MLFPVSAFHFSPIYVLLHSNSNLQAPAPELTNSSRLDQNRHQPKVWFITSTECQAS